MKESRFTRWRRKDEQKGGGGRQTGHGIVISAFRRDRLVFAAVEDEGHPFLLATTRPGGHAVLEANVLPASFETLVDDEDVQFSTATVEAPDAVPVDELARGDDDQALAIVDVRDLADPRFREALDRLDRRVGGLHVVVHQTEES